MKTKELEMVLALINARPPREGLTLPEQRAMLETLPGFPLAPDVRCQKVSADGVPAEWISTPQSAGDRVLLFLHGGGYALGSVNSHRDLIARLARASQARALAIDYRLAPENPFPAALEDSLAASRWLVSTSISPTRLVLVGASAGGGLALATLLALRDAAEKLPAAVVCLSPWVDLDYRRPSTPASDCQDARITLDNLTRMAQAYLGAQDPRHPLASPLYADLHGLPPMLIQVGSTEALFADSFSLANHARACRVPVTFESWEDMVHVWHGFASILPEGQQAIERVGAFIREQLK